MGHCISTSPREVTNGITVQKLVNAAPHFTVGGTGRSGTSHISVLLRKVKILCGHENWWTPHFHRLRWGLDGDASWMVAPLLDQYRGITLLQVRDPLKTIASYVGLADGAFMRGDQPDDVFWKLHVATLPRMTFIRNPVENAALWWLEINQHFLEAAQFWWRLEDLDAALLQRIAKEAGWNVAMEDCEVAVGTPATHKHPTKPARITWDDIPQPLRNQCRELAEFFGYEVSPARV